MKISLNKEMLEKLKGRIKLTTAAFALGVGLTLTGCGDVDAVEPTAPVTSEVVSEEISEEVSEEISEEVVEEVDYSAEAVMALANDIIASCPYDDPEQIKAAVVAVNLDYITDEDLDIILSTYGYSMEEMRDLFNAYMEQYFHHMWLTHRYNIGAGEVIDTMNLEEDLLDNRANIYDMFINQEEAKMTLEYVVTSLNNNETDAFAPYILPEEFPATVECPYNYESAELTDNHKALINYIILYNEVCGYADMPEIAQRLENTTLPFDAKINQLSNSK